MIITPPEFTRNIPHRIPVHSSHAERIESGSLDVHAAQIGACAALVCLIGFKFASSDLAFSLLADAPRIFAAAVLIMAVAVLTALWPAFGALRLEPYAAIRSGE